jgi:RNA polymerase sigma factor (sigma-70 family)
MTSSATDEQIMKRVSRGNLEEAGILYQRYRKMIYNYLLRLAFNKEISLDLTQNVFLRLIRYRKTYHAGQPFKPWLISIARNEWNDFYKKEGQYISNSYDLEAINQETLASLGNNERSEQVMQLQKAITLINPEYRQILILSKYMKLRYSEIAELLDSNENAVKGKVFRAMQQLREVFNKME